MTPRPSLQGSTKVINLLFPDPKSTPYFVLKVSLIRGWLLMPTEKNHNILENHNMFSLFMAGHTEATYS